MNVRGLKRPLGVTAFCIAVALPAFAARITLEARNVVASAVTAVPLRLAGDGIELTRLTVELRWKPEGAFSLLGVDAADTSRVRTLVTTGPGTLRIEISSAQASLPDGAVASIRWAAASDIAEGEHRIQVVSATGVDTAGIVRALAAEDLIVNATGKIRRRAVGRPGPAAPSQDLIEDARRKGEIDDDTALMYQVLSIFRDPRLPAKYRGDATAKGFDGLAVADAAARYDSLPPSIQEIIGPFLIPPFHQGSWANLSSGVGPSNVRPSEGPVVCGPLNSDWASAPAKSGRAKIWWKKTNTGDQAVAESLALVADKALDKFKTLLGKSPLPDTVYVTRCRGDDDALDVVLVDVDKSSTVPFLPAFLSDNLLQVVPSFILLKRDPPDGVEATLVHELFHVLQYTYDVKGVAPANVLTQYKWLMEATAQWAMHYYSPAGDSGKEQRAAPIFLNDPQKSLFTVNKDKYEYGAYLFFLFLSNRQGDIVVKDVWDATADNDSLEAVNKSITGGFKDTWPLFVLYNWNNDPVDRYVKWDGLTAAAYSVDTPVLPEVEELMDVDLPPLSAQYHRYEFKDPRARWITFYNAINFKLEKKNHQDLVFHELGPTYVLQNNGPEGSNARAKVQALIKIAGKPWLSADWSDKPSISFCRQSPDENLEELVVIYSNSDFPSPYNPLATGAPKMLKQQGETARLQSSNIGCAEWKGTISTVSTFESPQKVTFLSTVTFKRDKDQPGVGEPVMGPYFQPEGPIDWTATGQARDCSISGSGLMKFPSDATGWLRVYANVPKGSIGSRQYAGAAASNDGVIARVTFKCKDKEDVTLDKPFVWNTILERFFSSTTRFVDSAGTRIAGQDRPLDGSVVSSWDLTSSP